MTPEQIRYKLNDIKREILNIVEQFEQETDTTITELHLEDLTVTYVNGEIWRSHDFKIRVEI